MWSTHVLLPMSGRGVPRSSFPCWGGGVTRSSFPCLGGVPSPPSSSPSQLVLPLGGEGGVPSPPSSSPSQLVLPLGGDPALLPAVLLAILPSWSFLFGGSPVHHRKGHIGPLSVSLFNSIQRGVPSASWERSHGTPVCSVQLYSEGGYPVHSVGFKKNYQLVRLD